MEFLKKKLKKLLTNRNDSYIVVSMNNRKSQTNIRLNWFEQLCKKRGLKITPQRVAIYKALVRTDEHPSAEVVCKKVRRTLPNISLDTVNRTLLTLNEIGAAFIVEGSGEAKRFDAGMQSHQHFKCLKCKRIIDFHYEPFDNIPIPANIRKKFEICRKTVYIEGLCDICKEK